MKNKSAVLVLILTFAVGGVVLLGASIANSGHISLQGDDSVDQKIVKNDESASEGKYIRFTQGVNEPPDSVPILYEGPDQYDWSVVPIDDYVATPLFGINRDKGQQLFTVDCKHSHRKPDDPIVFPGKPGKSHLHEFFGEETTDAFSDAQSIMNSPKNNCVVDADRSSYWTPVAYQNGKIVDASNNKFYYKVGDVVPKDIQPMPTGLRMVAGDALSPKPQAKSVTYFYTTDATCPNRPPSECKTTEPHTQETSPNTKNMISTRPGERLHVLIRFPQCWDGKHLWLPGTAHMAYPNGRNCPSTHPIPLLQLQFNLGYPEASGGGTFELSSGPWYTMHGDFINGWHPETLERLTDVCLRAKRYCGLTVSDKHGKNCASRSGVKNKTSGCIELRKGEDFPRFFGKTYN